MAIAAIVGGAIALVVGLVAGIGIWLLPVGLIVGGLGAFAWWRKGHAGLVGSLGAADPVTLADPAAVTRIENLVEGLCIANGIPVPTLAVIDSDARNAAIVVEDAQSVWLVVTRGLLADLSRIELEGVVARELARVKSGEAAALSSAVLLSRLWPGAVGRVLHSRADVVADLDAVAFTRYPPGLLDALCKVEGHAQVAGLASWTAPLWIEDPVASAPGRADTFHTPIEERIATLREL